MKIDTGNADTIQLRPYRTALNNKKIIIDETVDEMLEAKVIRRSRSPWSFPVVIVDNKDHSKWFCVDFRKLNQVTKKKSYPFPVIDDILALPGKAKYCTSLDLESGYWQVLIYESDKEKTVLSCHSGLFEFNVMPFGLSMSCYFGERSGSVVECLTQDREVAGSSLTGVTALWSLSKTHLS